MTTASSDSSHSAPPDPHFPASFCLLGVRICLVCRAVRNEREKAVKRVQQRAENGGDESVKLKNALQLHLAHTDTHVQQWYTEEKHL